MLLLWVSFRARYLRFNCWLNMLPSYSQPPFALRNPSQAATWAGQSFIAPPIAMREMPACNPCVNGRRDKDFQLSAPSRFYGKGNYVASDPGLSFNFKATSTIGWCPWRVLPAERVHPPDSLFCYCNCLGVYALLLRSSKRYGVQDSSWSLCSFRRGNLQNVVYIDPLLVCLYINIYLELMH